MKKLISILLAMLLMVSMFPVAVAENLGPETNNNSEIIETKKSETIGDEGSSKEVIKEETKEETKEVVKDETKDETGKKVASEEEKEEEKEKEKAPCEHINAYELDTATCTSAGKKGLWCPDCEMFVGDVEDSPAHHKFASGSCSVCNEKDPDYQEPQGTKENQEKGKSQGTEDVQDKEELQETEELQVSGFMKKGSVATLAMKPQPQQLDTPDGKITETVKMLSLGESPAKDWELVDNGTTLIFSGDSTLGDYDSEAAAKNGQEWRADGKGDNIAVVVIKKAVTTIGDWALSGLKSLKAVFVEGNVTVDGHAMADDPNLSDVFYGGTVTYDKQPPTETGVKTVVAYDGDGDVNIHTPCNKKVDSYVVKAYNINTTLSFTNDNHNPDHVVLIRGYAPTEREFGLTDGYYCKDCKSWVVPQYRIYPNGKPETGRYKLTEFKNLKDIPSILKDIEKYNTLEKFNTFKDEFKDEMEKAFKDKFNKDMPKDQCKYYDIIEIDGKKVEGKHIVNVPYPFDGPDYYNYLIYQIQKDGTYKEIEYFATNKGCQIEIDELMPFAITWNRK